MKNLKTITTDEFLEKFDNNILEDEDLKSIYFKHSFEDTDNLQCQIIKILYLNQKFYLKTIF